MHLPGVPGGKVCVLCDPPFEECVYSLPCRVWPWDTVPENQLPPHLFPVREPGAEQAHLWPAASLWVLDLVQERFHNTSPGDHEGTFIKAGDSETRKGLA